MASNSRQMQLVPILAALICINFTSIVGAYPTKVPAKSMDPLEGLSKEQVVPDVIDTVPKSVLTVEFNSGVKAEMGKELTPTQVKDLPKITFDPREFGDAQNDKLYTIAMVDPDAPSRKNPTFREILHYMIANIPGNDLSKGETLAEYIGAGAPKGTGLHRYIFLLYQQHGGQLKSDMKILKTSRQGRVKFSIRKFAKDNNLGEPIAANFFQAQFDDYVPLLHEQLSG